MIAIFVYTKSETDGVRFEIEAYENGRLIGKYQTVELTEEEIQELEYKTSYDWKDYLRNNDVRVLSWTKKNIKNLKRS